MNFEDAKRRKEEIRESINLLFLPEDVVELRALSDFKTYSGYFKNHDKLSDEAFRLDISGENGIYVTLNEVNPVLYSRRADRIRQLTKKDAATSDADIIRRHFLPVDIDPVRPSGVSSSDDEHNYALKMAEKIAAFLSELGFPEPISADSGNGAHLLYRIDLKNSGDATILIKHCLETLDALFSDEKAVVDKGNYNASRIWKLYGTHARKGDSTEIRPHRRSGIISAADNQETVPKKLLIKLAEAIPGRNKKEIPPAGNSEIIREGNGTNSAKFPGRKTALADWLSAHNIKVRSEKHWQGGTLYILKECPFSSAHKDGAFAIQFENGAVFAGCHHNSCGAGRQRWQELRAMYEGEKTPGRKTVKEQNDNRKTAISSLSGGNDKLPEIIPEENSESNQDDKLLNDIDTTSAQNSAIEILKNGDPLKFILDTFEKNHVGDRVVAECMAMSVASQSVYNTSGLHVSVSGNSGKGKTHACKTMLKLLPEDFKLSGTVSDKALYYNPNLKAGTIFWFDDTALSDDFQEIIKNSTSNFTESIEHMTLTTERKLKICRIPERCVWWLSKVEDAGDDQVLNRMLTVWIDDSHRQDEDVLKHIKRSEAEGIPETAEHEGIPVCREIWRILKERQVYVRIPFAERIRFSDVHNRRNPTMLFDLIKSHALLFSMQRETPKEDPDVKYIDADESDFYAALKLYKKISRDNGDMSSNLTKNEANTLAVMEKMEWNFVTVGMIQEALGFSYYQVRRVFHGYSARGLKYAGLLEKCPAISLDEMVYPEECEFGTARKKVRRYSFNYQTYREWITSPNISLDSDGRNSGGDINNNRQDTISRNH
ncbi:hypothetical protein [Methanoplanus endosymbiosus]|uniref:Primase C-terminal 1 domain-containing protein n=1 Tax=Methanoplanus endosymbiosus TaxID=33865 RepID=A0A9E7TGZ8_9EURY|nr:hypothetical protein [Methanoplanus endosymbiosus]UUX91962.1 hypothetical protein L6E24_11430 [Methanoplanus endosymbiosus]